MARGKFHDKINWLVGSLFVGSMIAFDFKPLAWGCFFLGWLISTLIFSPDTDLRPKKRAGVLQFFLYPYSILSKHRGLSHTLFWGTLTRVLYSLLGLSLLIYILNKMGHIELTVEKYYSFLIHFFQNFDLQNEASLMTLWFFLGLAGADAGHILVDRFSSRIKKIF